jgi:hypothetical protein
MKDCVFWILTVFAAVACAVPGLCADEKILRLAAKGALDAMVGHVQGACASEDAIYFSHVAGIFKLDWNGNVIKHVPAQRHTGDLCYHDGKVYSVLGMWGSGGKTKVCRLQVWDADLNFLAEKPLPELKGLDGVTVLDGILYHGVGYSSPEPRSSHSLGRVDLKTMESLPQVKFELPYQTRFCQQNLTTDGKLIYMTFYPAAGASYALSTCDKDGKLAAHYGLKAGMGFERLPKGRFPGERPRFFKVNSSGGKKKDGTVKPHVVTLDFYELADGELRDITKR